MNFKSWSKLGLIALVAIGCDTVRTEIIKRTSEDGLTKTITKSVPVYEVQCTEEEQFGRDPSCGYETVCEWRYFDEWITLPNGEREKVRRRRSVCHDEMLSCYHLETVCRDVLSHYSNVTLNIEFDERAELFEGESEELELKASGIYSTKTLEIKSSYGRFEYEDYKTTFSAVNEEVTVNVVLKVAAERKLEQRNDLEVVSAGFEGEDTFSLVVKDPELRNTLIDQTIVKLKVQNRQRVRRPGGRGGNRFRTKVTNYIDGTIDLSKAEQNEAGELVLTFSKGEYGFDKSFNSPKKGTTKAKISVKRLSKFHEDDFSDSIEVEIK